jgi:hypothetical protein
MTLLELHVELGRVADALDKIVFLLEKLIFPPAPAEVKIHQATLDDLHTVTPEDHARIQQEQRTFAERYGVVAGSPAMMRAIVDWETEQRNIYGETWQAPDDWRSILAAIERGGAVRESAETAASADQRS